MLSIRHFISLFFSLLILSSPLSVNADDAGAVHLKLGGLRINQTSQSFDGMLHDVEPYSSAVLGLSIEKRLKRDFAIGFEVMGWSNEFTPPQGNTSDAQTFLFQVIGKKYFSTKSRFYPFVGVGIGGGTSRYSFCNVSGCFKDSTTTPSVQALAGVDMRFGKTSLMLEVKAPGIVQLGRDYAFDPNGIGLFLAIGQRW